MLLTVLVMHQPLASAFAHCAEHVLGRPSPLMVYDIPADADVDAWCQQLAQDFLQHPAQGLLILCDLYGATPFNIASQAARQARRGGKAIEVVSGSNLNMVLKGLTDPLSDLDALSASVRRGGIRGLR